MAGIKTISKKGQDLNETSRDAVGISMMGFCLIYDDETATQKLDLFDGLESFGEMATVYVGA
jgi:hypothetical protein